MTSSRKSEDFGEAELKHLEFVQGVIARLAQNSFLLKGWSVTLVAAILALSANNPGVYSVLIAILPSLVFWSLDAFYLTQEKHFRDLHKDAMAGEIAVLSMDPYSYQSGWKGWWHSVWSRSVLPFHIVIIIVVALIALLQL